MKQNIQPILPHLRNKPSIWLYRTKRRWALYMLRHQMIFANWNSPIHHWIVLYIRRYIIREGLFFDNGMCFFFSFAALFLQFWMFILFVGHLKRYVRITKLSAIDVVTLAINLIGSFTFEDAKRMEETQSLFFVYFFFALNLRMSGVISLDCLCIFNSNSSSMMINQSINQLVRC